VANFFSDVCIFNDLLSIVRFVDCCGSVFTAKTVRINIEEDNSSGLGWLTTSFCFNRGDQFSL